MVGDGGPVCSDVQHVKLCSMTLAALDFDAPVSLPASDFPHVDICLNLGVL